MNKINPELGGVSGPGVAKIIAELVLFLIALNRERSDTRHKLVVAERLKPAGCDGRSGKRKR